jgi:hypothetical protein
MHGDESAGPLAALCLLEENVWPAADLWLVPRLNPAGFRANSRTNAAGVDVNRDYRNPQSEAARGHIAWLEQQPGFDLTLLLHEDWEAHGFHCHELDPDGRTWPAPDTIKAVRPGRPIDDSPEIGGHPIAAPGIIRPNVPPKAGQTGARHRLGGWQVGVIPSRSAGVGWRLAE